MISRSLSFQSAQMVNSPFPKHAGGDNIIINIIMYLNELPNVKDLAVFIEENLLKFHRFRSIPVCNFWCQYWKDVEVNTSDHIFIHRETDDHSAHEKIVEIFQDNCNPDKPRWEFHLVLNSMVDTNTKNNSKHAIIFKVDHCVTDGVSLVKTFQGFLRDKYNQPLIDKWNMGLNRVSRVEKRFHQMSIRSKVNKFLTNFFSLLTFLFLSIKSIFEVFYATYGPFDDESPLTLSKKVKIESGPQFPKNIKYIKCPPINFEYIRKLKNEGKATINDILMSSLSGCLKRYCKANKKDENATNPEFIRAILPYAFLEKSSTYQNKFNALRNRWIPLSVSLHLKPSDPLTRLKETQKSIQALKDKKQPIITYLVHTIIGKWCMTRAMLKRASFLLFNKHTVVFSTVPTYDLKSQFCGKEVEELYVACSSIIPQVEILTYAGRLFLSFVVDGDIVKNPHTLPDLFMEELKELGKLLSVDQNLIN